MGVRQNLEKKIEIKRQEVVELEVKLRETQAFLSGMQEALKVLPREAVVGAVAQTLRAGSDLANARDYLARVGRPAHVTEILEELNKDGSTTRKRASITSSLASYARKGEIFKRTGPNVFALIELDVSNTDVAPATSGEEPPSDFGDLPDTADEETNESPAPA
jgi:hypothetical protein